MTITATIYNIAGYPFPFEFEYEVERYTFQPSIVTVTTPMFLDESFGDGWKDDLRQALELELGFDFTLKIK